MAPYLDTSLTGLEPWDIAQLQKRYGPPKKLPPTNGGFMDKTLILKLIMLALQGAEAYAKTTATPFDDIVVSALKRLVELLAGGASFAAAADQVKLEFKLA
jgi:hypothetical protein